MQSLSVEESGANCTGEPVVLGVSVSCDMAPSKEHGDVIEILYAVNMMESVTVYAVSLRGWQGQGVRCGATRLRSLALPSSTTE
jgi:hypothetical protein